MKTVNLSVVIIARNEEKKILDCLDSSKWADEIILVDNGSSDGTVEIAKKFGVNIIKAPNSFIGKYAKLRNLALMKATGKWIFYLDADERITPLLRKEIQKLIRSDSELDCASRKVAFAIPRRNIILGKEMKHGGWWPDYVKRLFKKERLKEWIGQLHEEPVFQGEMGYFDSPMVHLKHDNLSEMVSKTNEWSQIEAKLLKEMNHPNMTWWRFFRIMLSELWYRLVVLKAFRDGAEGIIYALYQMWSRFVTYSKLWEIQLVK